MLVLSAVAVVAVAAVALADDVFNTIENDIDAAAETMNLSVGGSNGTTTLKIQPRNSDGVNGCNVKNVGALVLNTHSSNSAVATVSPSTVSFDSCDDIRTLTVTPLTAGSTTITVSINTNNTGATFNLNPATFNVNVTGAPANVAPTVGLTGDDEVDEGDTETYSYTVTDPDDTPTVTTSCGSNATKSNEGAGTFDCTFLDGDGSSTVSVSADDGDASDSESIDVDVANVAPVVTLTGDANADEGSTHTYEYSATDVAADLPLTIVTSCGSGGTKSNDDGDSFDCTFPDGVNPAVTSAVSVSADDGDGGTDSETINVTVANINPLVGDLTVTNGSGTACLAGNTVQLDFGFTDPGLNDANWAVNIDWGDGGTDTTYSTASQNAQPQQSHTYSGAGSHQIVVTVTDKDGGAGQSDTTDGNVSFLYNMSGILAPFNPDGSSVWKYGSTLPVKVRITDCNGSPVTDLKPQVGTSMVSTTTPSEGISETASTSNADTTGVMRYSDGQYIYNFASKNLADGNATYWMYVRGKNAAGAIVTNPAQVSMRFGLKTK